MGAAKGCSAPLRLTHTSLALGRLNASRNIDQRSRGGKAVLGGSGDWGLQDALHHGDRRARDFQPLGIERHGHQSSPLRIDQVPGGRVAGLRPPLDQVPPFARPDRLDGNLRVEPIIIRQQRALPCRRARTPASGGWLPLFSRRVSGCGAPPASDTCRRAQAVVGAKAIIPWLPQLAP